MKADRRGAAIPGSLVAPMAKDAARAIARGDFGVAWIRYRRFAEDRPTDAVAALLAACAALAAGRPKDALPWLGRARRFVDDDVSVALVEQAVFADIGDTARSQEVWLDLVRSHGRSNGTVRAGTSLRFLIPATRRFFDSSLLHLLIADTAQAGGDWEVAHKSYRRAIGGAPKWAKPRINFGIGLLARGDIAAATRVLEEGLRSDPRNPKARLAFADAQLSAHRPEAALRDYQRVATDPKWGTSARIGEGRAQLAMGRPEEARKAFLAARRDAPGDPTPMIALGEWYARTSNHRAAAEAFDVALKDVESGGVIGARASLYRLLIEARIAGGDAAGVASALVEARAKEPDEAPLWWRLESRALRSAGDPVASEAALRAALESDRSLYPVETLRAIEDAGLARKFVATYRTALEGFRTGVRGSAIGGRIVIQSVQRSREGEIRCLAVLGHLHRLLGEPGDEVSVRRDLCRLRGNGRDWFLLGEAFERVGMGADARSAFREALVLGDLPEGAKASAGRRLNR